MKGNSERPIGTPEWVALEYWTGERVDTLVVKRSAALAVYPGDFASTPVINLVVDNVQGHFWILVREGESRSDALARVCGLLGIEVSR